MGRWHAAASVGRFVRDGWLMVGITVLLFLLLEWGYRLFAGSDDKVRRVIAVPPGHPYENAAWFKEFNDTPNGPNGRRFLVDPYRLYRLGPMRSGFLNVDSTGRRLTINVLRDSATALRVFMLGGSTMWGFTARDSFTIPSQLAAVLREHGFDNVEVRNLAETGYNSTQEATTLLLEVANGRIPTVAVFLNGYNDMATGFRWGEPGHVFDLELAQQRADAARQGLGGDLLDLSRRSRLIRRLLPQSATDDASPVDKATVCPALAGYYRNIAHSTAAIGQAYGFEVFYLMQPIHHTTGKPLSSFEQSLKVEPGFQHCTQAIDSAMQDWMGRNYFQAYKWFDDRQEAIFVDRNSHLTEAGSRIVAEHIAGIIEPVLRQKLATTPARP